MLPSLLETKQTEAMLAILEQWDQLSGSYTDNTHNYFLLLLFKSAMDTAAFCLCSCKQYKSPLSMCSLSIALADLVMVFFVATVWFLRAEGSSVSLCFFLAHASATFTALPLPMMSLGLLDYCLEDTYVNHHRTFCKLLRNVLLTLLVWALAIIYSFHTVSAKPMKLYEEKGMTALMCEVGESSLITYFILGLFCALLFIILPFWSRIPQWVMEADRLSNARTEHKSKKSDLMFTSTPSLETKSSEENHLEVTNGQRPPLWLSLTLGFGEIWMAYLATCVACMVCGLGVPAYVSVNVLWLECTNSLLVGLVFWVKSKTRGPYSHLPENVCSWNVYWHLSKGVQQKQLPVAVFNPPKAKRNNDFYV
ncbi:probable G-protein coupled receptor 160 [Amphiprion ocellaris]|uniref:G-protein coupled receptors family 1 profile domain-containing protein n=1 Tax=Amphiprion ocellaris TaxID=80972 RepID=A0AAQ5X9J8_AMPOC|nr:probable G-protein coupled receptor 160 [Amphiprion ocellaris]XP_023126629.2 probable G-protein coupled receptor 160 [Amphiprion ocellaris]XP_035804352.2 probable G-protein coupled receptor 160 [Amphiprion ocellaris]XP_054869225.1 probable G-protein coupled receptor 160 [Amphiprion ocellaris]